MSMVASEPLAGLSPKTGEHSPAGSRWPQPAREIPSSKPGWELPGVSPPPRSGHVGHPVALGAVTSGGRTVRESGRSRGWASRAARPRRGPARGTACASPAGRPGSGGCSHRAAPLDVADPVTHLEAGAAGKVRIGADNASGIYPTVCQGRRHLDPAHAPRWVRLYIDQVGARWAARLLADEAPPPEPGVLKGLSFFGATPEVAEHAAKVYLGRAEPAN